MCTKLLSLYDDLYNPDSPHILINSIRSFINTRLDHERKSPEFITEVRRRLYFLHEYNCQVAKATCKYPRTRKFDLLLVKYVELEFDVLYNNPHLSKQIEITTESRILRLLQVMLYPAVHNSEPIVNIHTDGILKKAVLQLLGEVRSRYLVENKLVCNIANKILRKTNGSSENGKKASIWEIHKNLATSDYGTDDSDSDTENDHSNVIGGEIRTGKGSTTISDCVEVPLTTSDATPIPTIEFVDDDNYFVYLQKGRPRKRKFEDNGRKTSAKRSSIELKSERTNHDPPCVSLCSDSEDEICEVTPNGHKTVSNNVKRKNVNKHRGVVTFEILDDDDDDDDDTDKDKPNYMVYLQKEVKTNTKRTKGREINCQEIVICSDSEDEISSKKSVKEEEIVRKEEESSVLGEIESEIKVEETKISKNDDEDNKCFKEFEDQHQPSSEITLPNNSEFDASTGCEDNIAKENNKSDLTTSVGMEAVPKSPDTKPSNMCITEEYPIPIASTSSHGYTDVLMLGNEVGSPLNENIETNFLIDPAVVFVPPAQCGHQILNEESTNKATAGQETTGCNTLGGPFLSEKVGGPDDVDNVQDCRINESFLDQLLLDDNYLLEGQKEFEELESFLFNEGAEKQGFYLSNFSFDDNENIMQPETFDADVKSLESLLHDSQLFNITDAKYQKTCNNDVDNEIRKSQWAVSVIKNPVSFEHITNITVDENKHNYSVKQGSTKFCRR